ncbi:translation initiation factor IF-2 subunit beta [archaeon]|nr:translation initiation factor IF-2 subunit beta [archaeon]NCP78965.1 translation initiation factor IF-2 subunit beta [archaeon]NCP97652.1 translation initiation factor IF-2 subunit beta [archaeon]NCQ06732.1 translation initiation factor IF-2 subunit beta [archaeon]NCQ50528.1 translation initiation factor IF-2 subunit beta [archaeon]
MVKEKTNTDNPLDYNSLLDRLYMSLPTKTLENTRFELPTVDSIVQGKQTIWKNFSKCAKDLKREELQMYKFVMKEISTSSTIVNGTLVLNGIFNNQKMNQILDKYLKYFVLCSACKKPDTEIVVQNNVKILKCTACGAISPLPKL